MIRRKRSSCLYPDRVTTPPPAVPPAPSAPGGTGGDRFARLRKATDRVPTKWFAAIGTGAFLVATAAFGGLDAVAVQEAPLAQLTAGQVHTSAQLEVSVERAALIDRLPGSGVVPDRDKGQRLLVVLVRMENRWDRPLASSSKPGFAQSVRLKDDPRPADGVVREDDQTSPLWLQPGVPALLAFTWAVDPDDYAGASEVTVVLEDGQLIVGQMLYVGEDWGDYAPAAEVTLPLKDVGAGAGS